MMLLGCLVPNLECMKPLQYSYAFLSPHVWHFWPMSHCSLYPWFSPERKHATNTNKTRTRNGVVLIEQMAFVHICGIASKRPPKPTNHLNGVPSWNRDQLVLFEERKKCNRRETYSGKMWAFEQIRWSQVALWKLRRKIGPDGMIHQSWMAIGTGAVERSM